MENLENTIIDYFANSISASEIAEKFNLNEEKTKEILWVYAQREWDDALVDYEWATQEQELALDLVLERAAEALKEMAKKDEDWYPQLA